MSHSRCSSQLPHGDTTRQPPYQVPPLSLTDLQTVLANAAVHANEGKVAHDSPMGLLLRRLTLAGQTLSFEALCALRDALSSPLSTPKVAQEDMALRMGRHPLAHIVRDAKQQPSEQQQQLFIASRVCHDLGRAVDLNHAASTDTQAALLSLATLLGNRGASAADELIRVAQQHADDVMLAHATAYCGRGAARASAAVLHLAHVVAYCDVCDAKPLFTALLSLTRLSHAVRLAPHSDTLYAAIVPRRGTEQALVLALDRMHATALLLCGGNQSYVGAQATAAQAVHDDVPSDDVAVAYAQLASNASRWDLDTARRLLDVAAARLPYYTGDTLAAARDALAFDAALGAHDWAAADALASTRPQRALLCLCRGEFSQAIDFIDDDDGSGCLLAARVLLAAGDWANALHRALQALLHTGDAEAAVLLAEALVAGGHSTSHAAQLLSDAVPVLMATRRAWPLAKAHCLLAACCEGSIDTHLSAAAALFAQVGAWEDAAEAWQLLALRCEGDARQARAAQARKYLSLLVG